MAKQTSLQRRAEAVAAYKRRKQAAGALDITTAGDYGYSLFAERGRKGYREQLDMQCGILRKMIGDYGPFSLRQAEQQRAAALLEQVHAIVMAAPIDSIEEEPRLKLVLSGQ